MIEVIGLDADDTLWATAYLYNQAIVDLAVRCPSLDVGTIVAVHSANVAACGYGALALRSSMIETVTRFVDDPVEVKDAVTWIVATTEAILSDPAEPLPGVTETLSTLVNTNARLVVITKGSPAEQLAKLTRSGLDGFMSDVFVLDHKTRDRYEGVLSTVGVDPTRFVMVGDSLYSDVLPVVECGATAVFVPPPGAGCWEDERLAVPAGVTVLGSFRELPETIENTNATLKPAPYAA